MHCASSFCSRPAPVADRAPCGLCRLTRHLIADDLVVGSVLDAIDVHGESEYLNEIRGNIVSGGNRAGTALGNSGGTAHEHRASGEGNWLHGNDLIVNKEGITVILGTPETVIEENRIVSGDNSDEGIHLDDAPDTIVRGNVLVSSGDFEPLRVDEDDVDISANLVE